MSRLSLPLAAMILLSLLLRAAIFGFFYAWICSTMWGLDSADPRTAIAAMQAMNGSVRNIVFFPAFFLTPAALAITTLMLLRARYRLSAVMFGSAALIYLLGALLLTMFINVPMYEALGALAVPQDVNEAAAIWQNYSQPWQFWNITRTIVSGVALLLVGAGMLALSNETRAG